jgi:hypothetical protein
VASPLSPLLVSILQGALTNAATHVDISPTLVVLWRGDTRLGDGDLPAGSFDALVTSLRMHAQIAADATTGRAVFHGPLGPVPVDLLFADGTARMTFATDPHAVEVEHTINSALGQAAALGADSIVFAPTGIGFWNGPDLVGVASYDAALLPAIITHTREPAVAFGASGQRLLLTTTVEPRDGADAAVMRLSTKPA